jgi:hypothetical protein
LDTSQLIDQISENIEPTGQLSRPWVRTGIWFSIAIPYAIAIILIQPLAFDHWKIADVRFVIEQMAAIATAVLSANAAFQSIIPGFNRLKLLWPFLPLLLWLLVLGDGCWRDWQIYGNNALSLRDDWGCLPPALAISLLPAITIVVMLRRGAPLIPHVTLAFASMAVVAFANFTMRFHHYGDASIIILVWHFGMVVAFTLVASMFGAQLLNWRHVRSV